MGDIKETFITLIQGNPDVDFTFVHVTDGGEVRLSCAELRSVLGDGIPLSSAEVLEWIRGYLTEAYDEIK